jgi:4-hydroxy-tetrahydrodipicolinate reductase
LIAGVSRTHAGKVLADVLHDPRLPVKLVLQPPADPCAFLSSRSRFAKANILRLWIAVTLSWHFGPRLHDEIDRAARTHGRGVRRGNFALTAVRLQKFALLAAKYLPNWEIVEFGSGTKLDVPSGTVRELALRLSQVRQPAVTVAPAKTVGPPESRGATVAGTQVHSVRLPGHVLGVDVIYGMPDQTLTLRHQAGASARPYVDGALLAICKVSGLLGVHRDLDKVMDL